MPEESTKIELSLPKSLVHTLTLRLIGTDYKNVSDYLTAFLIETLGQEESGLTEDEEKNIRSRLATLGYE
jgi:hypothetical protein